MISTLRKVNKMASNDENLVKSAYWKLKEFARLKYPIPALLRACSVVAVTTRNPAWFQVINTFKRHHTQTQTKTLRAYGGATERSEGRSRPAGRQQLAARGHRDRPLLQRGPAVGGAGLPAIAAQRGRRAILR